MKVRSPEALYDLIAADEAWRKRELTIFRREVDRSRPEIRPALLRASVALLYAHWEGFVKNVCYWYLCYVASKRLSLSRLRPELVAMSLRGDIEPVVQRSKTEAQVHVIIRLRERSHERATLPTHRDAVRTASNLSSTVLRDVLISIGCDPAPYASYADLIDDQLVSSRNRIAHGEEDYIHLSEWNELREKVLWMMDDISTQVVNSAINRAYEVTP